MIALAIPLILRFTVLHNMPVSDDETCYEFMARLLASGRLSVPSPPAKLFYDHLFMINNGRLFSQYFIGWPAMMIPGVWIGLPAAANALYSALTVLPLYDILQRLASRRGAQLGILLYLLSPFLMLSAATTLSHTSCIMTLTWMIWFFFRLKERPDDWFLHAFFVFFFCLAFFIRPTAALGIGIPFLLVWAMGQLKRPPNQWRLTLGLASAVTVIMGTLFLWVNYMQCGHPLLSAYRQYIDYSIENGCRFSVYPSVEFARNVQMINMNFSEPLRAVACQGIALFRLNYSLWGWPAALLFIPFGVGCQRTRIFTATLGSFFLIHFFVGDQGIDAFGPVHYTELAIPLIILTVAGVRQIHRKFRGALSSPQHPLANLPIAVLASLILTGFFGTTPIRLATLFHRTARTAIPFNAVQHLQLNKAIVFTSKPFAPMQENPGHVFARPNNHPDLDSNILWVNHISLEDDRRFMQLHPERTGHVMVWFADNSLGIIPLNELNDGDIPNGIISGTGKGPDWSTISLPLTSLKTETRP